MMTAPQISSTLSNLEQSSQGLPLQSNALKVIQSKCVSCHNSTNPSGGIAYLTDVNSLLYYGLVIPGEPQISHLYQLIQTGRMPPNAPLKAAESQAIYDWIYSGIPNGGGGSVSTPPTATTLTATFTSINTLILKPKCLGCHNSGNAQGGVSYTSYTSTMSTVIAGNVAGSSLFAAVNSGIMPKNGTRLSTAEITAISNWISNSATNN